MKKDCWLWGGVLAAVLVFTAAVGLSQVLAGPVGPAAVAVAVRDFEYDPWDLEIDLGETVRWTNEGGFHNVVSIVGPTSFSSGNPSTALWSYEVTFDEPGLYVYICTYPGHRELGMEATITVVERFFSFTPLVRRSQ